VSIGLLEFRFRARIWFTWVRSLGSVCFRARSLARLFVCSLVCSSRRQQLGAGQRGPFHLAAAAAAAAAKQCGQHPSGQFIGSASLPPLSAGRRELRAEG